MTQQSVNIHNKRNVTEHKSPPVLNSARTCSSYRTVLNLIPYSTLFGLKPAVYCSLSYYHNKLRTHKHSNAVTKEHRVDRVLRQVILYSTVYNNWILKWLCKMFSAKTYLCYLGNTLLTKVDIILINCNWLRTTFIYLFSFCVQIFLV